VAIETVNFDSKQSGTKLLVFGGIHGDEVCGPSGIRAVIADFESGILKAVSGSVTFVPVCNAEAYAKGERCLEADLNRVFENTDQQETKEAMLANELCRLVDQTDVLLDLHSSSALGPVNAFIDYPTPENKAFVASLGAEFEILGWPNVYANSETVLPSRTTEQYAHEAGKIGTTFECGQHQDPASVEIAKRTIVRALAYLRIIDSVNEPLSKATRVTMTKVYVCEDNADTLLGPWKHLEKIPAGTCIARRASGEEISVDVPSIIVFPFKNAVKGDEWFYLGVEESR
jgi:predicted deacylase